MCFDFISLFGHTVLFWFSCPEQVHRFGDRTACRPVVCSEVLHPSPHHLWKASLWLLSSSHSAPRAAQCSVPPAVVWDSLLLLPGGFCALLLRWFVSFSSCSIPSSGLRLAIPACRWVLCFTGLLVVVAVAFPAEYTWGHLVYTMVHCTNAFHWVRGLHVWPFF